MPRLAWLFVAIALMVGGGIAAAYGYESAHYVDTAYAQVVSPSAEITAPAAGTLSALRLPIDKRLAKGATVGDVTTPRGITRPVRLAMPGRVAASFAAVGDTVTAGQELGQMVDLRASVVVAQVPESAAGRVRVGQSAELTFPDDPSTVHGHVVSVGRAALVASAQAGPPSLTETNATEYVPVTIQFRKGGLRVVDGLSVAVRIHVG